MCQSHVLAHWQQVSVKTHQQPFLDRFFTSLPSCSDFFGRGIVDDWESRATAGSGDKSRVSALVERMRRIEWTRALEGLSTWTVCHKETEKTMAQIQIGRLDGTVSSLQQKTTSMRSGSVLVGSRHGEQMAERPYPRREYEYTTISTSRPDSGRQKFLAKDAVLNGSRLDVFEADGGISRQGSNSTALGHSGAP